jgi:hypothetical protein
MRGLALALALLPLAAGADETVYRSASVASRWLSVPGSARVAGLAGAFAARGAEPGALESNPSGLAGIRNWQGLLTHNAWIGGMSVDRLVGAMNMGCLGTFGASIDYLNLGSADRYVLGNGGVPEQRGSVSSNSWALGAAWAGDFGALALGLSLRGLSENVASGSSAGFQADLGGRWNFEKGYRAGLSAQNLGLDLTNAVRPITLRAGFGHSSRPYGKALALDANLDYRPYDDETPLLRAAAEWAAHPSFILRLGYVLGNERQPTGPTLGVGWLQGSFDLDYALYGAGELGLTHLLSLRVLAFGGAK